MGHISESLWGIIRSPEGMKTEIIDMVQSIYNKLVDPNGTQTGHSMQESTSNQQSVNGGCFLVSTRKNDAVSDSEPKEPPGFFLTHNRSSHDDRSHWEQRPIPHERASSEDLKDNQESAHNNLTLDDSVKGVSNGFTMPNESEKLSDCSDEDPPLPPGFG